MISNCFPFFIRYWREVFNKWEDGIDKLYVSIEKPVEPSTEEYVRKLFKHPKIVLGQGYTSQFNGLTEMFHNSHEDLVVVLHDDTFILNRKPLDKYFKLAEEKIVVPLYPHYNPADYLEPLMRELFPTQVPFVVEETGETGYSFLLYFFFASRKALEKTSAFFGGSGYEKGEYFPPFKRNLEEKIGGDTGFLLGLELLANGKHFVAMPHVDNTTMFLSRMEDPLNYLETCKKNKTGLFAVDWLHVMQLANQAKSWFKPLSITGGKPHIVEDIEGLKEDKVVKEGFMVTMAWFNEFLDCDTFSEVKDYRDYVTRQMEFIADRFNLDKDKIQSYKKYFHEIIWRK
jgi:hypothetical protein